MPAKATERALHVLRRALEAGRMDPNLIGIRLTVGPGGDLRTGFTDAPEPGDVAIETDGLKLFLSADLAEADVTIDVSSEHDRIVLGPPSETAR